MKRFITIWLCIFVLCIPYTYSQSRDLNYYLRLSSENSPLLKDYNNRVVINKIDSLIHQSNFRPAVGFSTSDTYAPTIKGYGYDHAIIDGGNYNALLSINQVILGKKNRTTQLESYNLESQTIRNNQKLSEQDLKSTITTQYIAAYGNLQEISYQEEILSLMKKEGELLRKLTEKTVYKQTDYLNFRISLQQQQLSLQQQKADYNDKVALLNYLCGEVDTGEVILEDPEMVLKLPLPFESTLQHSQFRIDSLKNKNSDALIDYGYRPKVNVFADAGFNSTLRVNPYKNFGASIGLTLSVPIYDGGLRKKQHHKIKVSEQTRQDYQQFAHHQYEQKLAQLYQQLRQTDGIIAQAQIIVTQTQTLMNAYSKLLQSGDIGITDYILTLSNFLNAKHVVTVNLNNKQQIINLINYWNYE